MEITKDGSFHLRREMTGVSVQCLQECELWLGTYEVLSPSTPLATILSAQVTRDPGTGLGLRKELWNVGEERKWASKGPALINSLASNLWYPCVAPSACPCERLIGRLRATGRLIYESG